MEQGWCMVGARGMFGARLGQGCPNHALCPNHAPTLPQIFRVFAPTIPQPCPNHTSVDDQIIKGSPKTLGQHTRGFILKSKWHESYQSTPFLTVWHLQMSPFWCRMIVKIVIIVLQNLCIDIIFYTIIKQKINLKIGTLSKSEKSRMRFLIRLCVVKNQDFVLLLKYKHFRSLYAAS